MKHLAAGIAAAALLAGLGLGLGRWSRACGPFYREPVYADPRIPDVPRADLAQGRYGILRPGLPWADLLRIYRHQRGWAPLAEPEADPAPPADPLAAWRAERAKVLGPAPAPAVARTFETGTYVTVNQVGDDALRAAAGTLAALVREHGSGPEVRAWVQAQDLVFAATPQAPRLPEPAAAPGWLARERAYQVAAARFYSGQWDEARKAFLDLAGDPAQPRRAWGRYLAARCLVRQAELGSLPAAAPAPAPAVAMPGAPAPPLVPAPALARYREAQDLLEATLRDPACAPAHGAARDYLELVRYRTGPQALLAEFLDDRYQADPRTGPHSAGRIADALRFLPGGRDRRPEPLPLPAEADLAWWLGALSDQLPWRVEPAEALARWRARPGEAWLAAALALAPEPGPGLEPLLAAARQVPEHSPFAPTVRWHLLRLELAGLEGDALAGRLEMALAAGGLPPWAVNDLRARRQALARDPATWLAFAGRRAAAAWYDGALELPGAGPAELFDPATARALGEQLPLARVEDLVRNAALAPNLAQDLAGAAWTRAVLLETWDQARALAPLLPAGLREEAARALAAADPAALRFQAALVVMAWPGLGPAVAAGYPRQYARPEGAWDAFDVMRDNWWCGADNDPELRAPARAVPAAVIPGLAEADREAARRERERLDQAPSAQLWFGRTVLAYARAHPRDPRVPQALHRLVGTLRSPLCPSEPARALGREAFRRLHRDYPGSPWARKTPYYY